MKSTSNTEKTENEAKELDKKTLGEIKRLRNQIKEQISVTEKENPERMQPVLESCTKQIYIFISTYRFDPDTKDLVSGELAQDIANIKSTTKTASITSPLALALKELEAWNCRNQHTIKTMAFITTIVEKVEKDAKISVDDAMLKKVIALIKEALEKVAPMNVSIGNLSEWRAECGNFFTNLIVSMHLTQSEVVYKQELRKSA